MEKSRLGSSGHRLREGNWRVQKQRSYLKLATDSRSGSIDTTAENLFKYRSGWRFPDKALGMPIKNLLAQEMSRETVSRKRSPGLIARLMGLDGLPPQQPSQKQQRRSSGNYLQSTASTEKAQRNSTSSGGRSSRKSFKEEREFKDVFEVSDVSKLESKNYSSPGSANSELTETQMAFIQRKFMNAKRLSTDAKLQDSKEFDEVIEDLDSNKDLLLRFLDQPDSLFSKHLHDLQGVSFQSHCGHLSAKQSSYVPQLGSSGLGCKMDRETARRSRRKPNDDTLNFTRAKDAAFNQLKSLKFQLEGKDETTVLPTRIVVLKPNVGRLQNASRNESSPRSSYDFLLDHGKHTELNGIKKREPELSAPKRFPVDEGLSRYQSKESREIAKQITKQMRSGLHSGSVNVCASKSRGYAGDESSSDWSENESAYESDVRAPTSRNPIEWSNHYRSSSSRSTESSVNREAKKRLSERWKMTSKSIDMGVVSRGSTLGEMLAIPHREVRPASPDAIPGGKRFSQNLNGLNGLAGWVEPLGISSMDGWKGESIRNLTRPRSLPSLTAISSPRKGMHYDTLSNDRYILPKEVFLRERNKSANLNCNQKDGSSFRTSRCRSRNSHISPVVCSVASDISPEIHFSHNQKQGTEDDPVEQYHIVPETLANNIMDTGLASKSVMGMVENAAIPSEQEFLAYPSTRADSFSTDLDGLRSQEEKDGPPKEGSITIEQPLAEVESSASSKEAYQPSPVSVLEAPFPDDPSSGSECFGSLSADLHGLWTQLQLLKLESEAYPEGPMLISSDEDREDASVGFSDERGVTEENREFSYIVELLLNSGINDADPDTYVATCHSPECPVSPKLFEELEKKYCDHGYWPRSDRKLLFDRMNLALVMIYQKFTDPHPWVRPTTKIGRKWIKNGLEDGLHKLLSRKNKKGASDQELSREPEWLDVGEDIDVIGREIERLLTEELVAELVLM